MDDEGWTRWTPHALVATAVFGTMHVADEMYANWDAAAAGAVIGDATMASLNMGVFVLVGMWALWWILTERPWGYALAGILGLFFLLTGGSHFMNTADMTTFRWIVVVLQVVSSATVLVLGAQGTLSHKPWSSGRATGT